MNIEKSLKSVPFGDSQFQIKTMIANEDTPERTYRKALLQLDKKYQAMKECSFRRRRKEIDIAEIDDKLKTAEGWEKQRLEIDREEAEYYLEHEIKLIEDCAIEIATYEAILDKLPDFTREEFELAEYGYWKTRLLKNAQKEIEVVGTVQVATRDALEKIGIKIQRNLETGKHEVVEIENKERELIDIQ